MVSPLRRDAERIQKALERAREIIELPFRGRARNKDSKPTLSSVWMTKTEAQRVAAQLGLHYDGIQEGIGHQFTDREVTGTTFYGNTPSEVKARLVEKRKLFRLVRP